MPVQYHSSAATTIAASGSSGVSTSARHASHHRPTTPMNAGSTMTSRDSHEVRHISAARQARSGRPRWPNEAPRPISSIASARISAPLTKPAPSGTPASSASASVTTRPCAAPAMVVKTTTENAGFTSALRPTA